MSRFFSGRTGTTPPVVKNLIILNVGMWLITMLIYRLGSNPNSLFFNIEPFRYLGLFPVHSPLFIPSQIVTHMFMHDVQRIFHIFFNMWALYMFGRTLESVWGSKRFLIYYLATGLGAAAFHLLVNYLQFAPEIAAMKSGTGMIDPDLIRNLRTPTVGASGAVYGVLLAFGMLFPNTPLFIIPFPFPIKAKWLVIGAGVIELYMGIMGTQTGVAHFAHLGGMIFGFILIKYWNRFTRNFY